MQTTDESSEDNFLLIDEWLNDNKKTVSDYSALSEGHCPDTKHSAQSS